MKNPTLKKLAYVTLAVLLFASFIYVLANRSNTPTPNSDQSQLDDGINYGPATDEEKAATEEYKKELGNKESEEQTTGNNNASKKSVKPIITVAAQSGDTVQVRVLVTGVYEAGGECIAKFTRNSSERIRKVEGLKDATTTRCDVIDIPSSEFSSPGTWMLSVSYVSKSAEGVSEARSVEVNP